MARKPRYRYELMMSLPSLRFIDGKSISAEERERAYASFTMDSTLSSKYLRFAEMNGYTPIGLNSTATIDPYAAEKQELVQQTQLEGSNNIHGHGRGGSGMIRNADDVIRSANSTITKHTANNSFASGNDVRLGGAGAHSHSHSLGISSGGFGHHEFSLTTNKSKNISAATSRTMNMTEKEKNCEAISFITSIECWS